MDVISLKTTIADMKYSEIYFYLFLFYLLTHSAGLFDLNYDLYQ